MTVFSGMNGAGKSSVLQALLLMRQAATNPERGHVELNDPRMSLALGEAMDVLNILADRSNGIALTIKEDEAREYSFHFGIPHERSQRLSVTIAENIATCSLAGLERQFCYLCAERVGPRDVFEAVSLDRDNLNVGTKGEAVAQVLATPDSSPISEKLVHPETTSRGTTKNLRDQTELWLSSIVCPIQINAQWVAGTSVTTLRFKPPGFLNEWIRPGNTGFGLTYAIPIIVSGLAVKAGGTIIVENPEAHLHPQGQTQIGEFLARVCGSGIQVIVETHSDHVLNGIRKAVAIDRRLRAEDVAIFFFDTETRTDGSAPHPKVVEVKVRENGELSPWPKRFFDQIERDLRDLAKVRKQRP
jgi:predicted ATPase